MIVVADAVPIQYLVRIGAIDALGPLYQRVLVPQTGRDRASRRRPRRRAPNG